MANHKSSAAVSTSADASTPAVSAATKKLVDAVREPFSGYVSDMNALLVRASKLAPAFMRAANAWMADTGKGFVHFVRELDPAVPAEQKGYRDNATYNRAVYLKNLVNKPKRTTSTTANVGPPPVPPLDGLARLIAAIKPLIPEDNLVKLWEVIATELHWSEAQKSRLQTLVDQAEPLFNARAPRGGPRPVLRIAKPLHRHGEEEEQTTATA